MKYRATAAAWFSTFFEKAFVSLVNRRIDMRIVRFWRSTYDVEMCLGSGSPLTFSTLQPRHTAGLYRLLAPGLPPGTYDIAVFAWSTAQNTFVPAKVVRVNVR